MRKIIFYAFALTSMAAAAKSPEVASDTLKTIPRAENIVITRSGDQTVIRALEPNENKSGGQIYTYTVTEKPDSAYRGLLDLDTEGLTPEKLFRPPFATSSRHSQKEPFKPSRFITGLRYIYWGWTFNYETGQNIDNSYELGVADLIGAEWETSRSTRLGLGVGFGMQRVVTADHRLFATDGDVLSTTQPDADSRQEYARLDNLRLQLPLYWRQRLAGRFGISLAAIVNFNFYSTATNRFHSEQTTYTETITGLRQRLLTCDLMATIGLVDGIGAYVKWSPVSTFSRAYGPASRTVSAGINLNF